MTAASFTVYNSLDATRREQRRTDAALYVLWLVFWMLMILIALQDAYDKSVLWWEPLLWEGSSAVFATLWLVLQRKGRERYAADLASPTRWFWRHLQWSPLIACTFIVLVYGVRHTVYAAAGETYEHEPWLTVFVYESIKLALFFGLWLGIIFGFESFAQWRVERERLLVLQKTLAETQLAQLRAQLRPHFFFNALNTISALMHVDVDRADQLLASLGELLRASLRAADQELTSLHEELRLAVLYAQVMRERFADRVELGSRIDEDALAGAVPALLLQPLLENAFRHGVERTTGHVDIEIEARRIGPELHITIRNSGELAPAGSAGIGLENCRERLRVMYGDAARLSLEARDGAVEARVILPWREVAG